jgi:hypothetical protein
LAAGGLAARIVEGDLRGLTLDGAEVLRRVSMPVRDASWGTMPVRTLAEQFGGAAYRRDFAGLSGDFEGRFEVALEASGTGGRAMLRVTIRALRDIEVNRAGFTLLHPIRGVAGTPLEVIHPDGRRTAAGFPRLISPGQPARDIAGLTHRVGPVAVRIAMAGDVFEMEDQRNWSDASFKTYCRPLSLPRPYTLPQGAVVEQTITVDLVRDGGAGDRGAAGMGQATGRMPEILLAHEDGLTEVAGAALPAGVGLLARVNGRTGAARLAALRGLRMLEIVFEDSADLAATIARCKAAGLAPDRVVALPVAYLASHQPEGPWPEGPRPADAVAPLRAGFPGAQVGSGSLTNFTEFNRCRPDAGACDFGTFGSTAIVHAADDLSVIETLEALPDILESAHAIMGTQPLHLGLVSIGMRSNPYGAGVVPNPAGLRLPMAMNDPRQGTVFAAAWAVGVLAAAAAGGAASLAPAMVGGPLGAAGRPLMRVIAGAARMAGQKVGIDAANGVVRVTGARGGMVANLAETTVRAGQAGQRLTDAGELADAAGELAPREVLLWGDAA